MAQHPVGLISQYGVPSVFAATPECLECSQVAPNVEQLANPAGLLGVPGLGALLIRGGAGEAGAGSFQERGGSPRPLFRYHIRGGGPYRIIHIYYSPYKPFSTY
jgi:hypothetical protein